MSNTNALTNEDVSGSRPTKLSGKPVMPALKSWNIAELPLFRFKDGQLVDVESASDAQFEAWRKRIGIPVKENGIVEWSFEMRCRAINHCRFYGLWDALTFPIEVSAPDEQTAQKSADDAQESLEE